MNTANQLYAAMTLAYQNGDDAEVLRLGEALEGKRLAKSKKTEVTHMMESTKRLMAQEAFRAQYHGKTFKARVDWFDSMEGHGYVTLSTGFRALIYACNIPGKKTWFEDTACVYYEKGQEIEVTIDASTTTVFVIGVTPGILDAEKWETLKDKNLAFRCNGDGTTTGLFA